MNIIALTKRGRDTPNYFVYEGSAGGVLLTYIDRQVVPDDPVPELVTVEVVFHGPAVAAFRDFLADSIEVHDSGRITIADIWEAWAAHWGVDHGDNLIGSISQQDVTMHFRGHFLAPEQVRARVEGRVQRCWTGYRMIAAEA